MEGLCPRYGRRISLRPRHDISSLRGAMVLPAAVVFVVHVESPATPQSIYRESYTQATEQGEGRLQIVGACKRGHVAR